MKLYIANCTKQNRVINFRLDFGRDGMLITDPRLRQHRSLPIPSGGILDVPGISGIYIGPSDLGLSLGLVPKLDREEPQILTIYDKLLAAIKKRNLFAGIHNGTAGYAAKMIGKGFRFVTIANDSGLMAMAARAALDDHARSLRPILSRRIAGETQPGSSPCSKPSAKQTAASTHI